MKTIILRIIPFAIVFFSLNACIIEESPILIDGEFERVDGTCTPYCYINIDDGVLTLEGINEKGSTDIVYSEQYERSEDDINRYYYILNRDAYIEVTDKKSFSFVSTLRVCDYMQ